MHAEGVDKCLHSHILFAEKILLLCLARAGTQLSKQVIGVDHVSPAFATEKEFWNEVEYYLLLEKVMKNIRTKTMDYADILTLPIFTVKWVVRESY